jgi:murein L,D-transpeptidase YcbB/YkuD
MPALVKTIWVAGAIFYILIFGGCKNPASHMRLKGSANAIDSPLIHTIKEYLNADKPSVQLLKINQLHSKNYILQGYKNEAYEPFWSSNGKINQFAEQALNLLSHAGEYGLISGEYDFMALNNLAQKILKSTAEATPKHLAAFDLRLTNSILLFISHLHNGRLDPFTLQRITSLHRSSLNLFMILEEAFKADDFNAAILKYQPQSKSYKMLQAALVNHLIMHTDDQEITLPDPKKNPAGFKKAILKILIATDCLPDTDEAGLNTIRWKEYNLAIKKFQHFHCLPEDGVLNSETVSALSFPLCMRVQKIVINMERWRWEPDYVDDYFFINIPTFTLHVMHNETVLLKHKVIVGLPEHPTPTLSAILDYIIIYPTWYIPHSISSKEILPILKENPSYLDQKNYILFDSNNKEIDPYSIDWEKITEDNFKFSIHQGSGDDNALGLVKFLFKNNYSVYLHDTPYKSLFEKEERAFSHGCVRLENPLLLANFLLKRDTSYITLKKLEEFIEKKTSRTIQLKHPIPIHIKYFTCKATEEGLFFYSDIYNSDEKLIDAFY